MLDADKLKRAQAEFFMQYPGGFNDPEILQLTKRHRMDKMTAMVHEYFSPEACANSMVAAVNSLSPDEKAYLVNGLSQFLHGKTEKIQRTGFEAFADILRMQKLAKWSLLTIIPAYYHPKKEVFVKPTTAKNILKYFEIDDPVYKPAPTWEFYKKYRRLINAGKKQADKSLSPSNAAFSGFLMMATKTTPQ